MRTIHRYEVPVDGQWHTLELSGEVLHVATRGVDMVELWALHTDDAFTVDHDLRVYGTGHPLPDDAWHVGTAIDPSGLVWHLMEQR